jgi:hypothetical protein
MMEVIHHAMDAKLLQHSAITPWLTYGGVVGGALPATGWRKAPPLGDNRVCARRCCASVELTIVDNRGYPSPDDASGSPDDAEAEVRYAWCLKYSFEFKIRLPRVETVE